MTMQEAVAGRPSDSGGRRVRVLGQATVVQYEWGGAWVVGARGSYDMDSVTDLADALAAAAEKHTKVVLEASGITFADSVLLNVLILTHQAVDLRVAAPTEQLRRLLHITGVDTVLKVAQTLEEAAAD
ncbi:MAG TPA: STAS domain-containing protein [Streptomyces sp.]|nr:STAS domain-containing protein [Streptomyces sp.]